MKDESNLNKVNERIRDLTESPNKWDHGKIDLGIKSSLLSGLNSAQIISNHSG